MNDKPTLRTMSKVCLGHERHQPAEIAQIEAKLHYAQTQLLELLVEGSLWKLDHPMARMMVRELENMKEGYRV